MERKENSSQIKDIVINKMPDKELLEDYLRGVGNRVLVVFNLETGEFERIRTKEEVIQNEE